MRIHMKTLLTTRIGDIRMKSPLSEGRVQRRVGLARARRVEQQMVTPRKWTRYAASRMRQFALW